MKAFVRALQDAALLLARLAFAFIMIMHGWRRYHTLGLDSQVAYLREQGVPYPDLLAYGGTTLEVVGAILLAFGLFTPVLGLAFLVEQILIIIWLQWSKGFWLGNGGYEYSLALAALALVFTFLGAGRLAIDGLFRRPKDEDDAALTGTTQ